MAKQITHQALFEKLQDTGVIARNLQYARWTLPQLMADLEQTRGQSRATVERDYQEVGALLVNNLASKLGRLLFPASTPFFRIKPSPEILAEADAGGRRAELTSKLSSLELASAQRLFLNASYAQLLLCLRHLIVTGNALLHRDSKTNTTVVYGMQSFGIRRDGRGNLLDCVLREFTYAEALDPDVQLALRAKDRVKYSRPECEVALYTRIRRVVGEFGPVMHVSQEVDTIPVGEPSTFPEHLCPWTAPTWSIIPGEHMGRGLVEDYAGGFAKLSDLSEAAALYGVEMMRVVHLVSAGSGTDIDDLAQAEHGEYIRGDPNGVVAHESGDSQKLVAVQAEIEQTFARLARAFMYQANTRDAERVTAFELQQEAQEVEHTLGGAYSTLASTLQVPLAAVLIQEEDPAALAGLVTGDIRPHIMAGIPALGRTSDVQNLLLAVQESAAALAITQFDQRYDPQKIVDLVMAGRSVDTEALRRTEQQMQELQNAAQQQAQGMQQVQQAQGMADAAEQLQGITNV